MKPASRGLFVCCCVAAGIWAQEKVNQDSLILSEFQRRVSDYVKLHNRVRAQIRGLKPTSSPDMIETHEHKFTHRMREARRGAKQGDVFTPETAVVFRKLIRQTMQGAEGSRIQASLQHDDQPVKLPEIRIDSRYPESVPLPSTPPSVLMNLPPLPPELEYRLVGRTLILRDQSANLIVDFIPNALP